MPPVVVTCSKCKSRTPQWVQQGAKLLCPACATDPDKEAAADERDAAALARFYRAVFGETQQKPKS